MRLIGSLNNEKESSSFSRFLHEKRIAHEVEIKKNTDWGSAEYGLNNYIFWIENEDHFQDADKWFKVFKENPKDPIFDMKGYQSSSFASSIKSKSASESFPPPLPHSITSWERQPMGWITRGILATCVILFFLSQLWTPQYKVPAKYSGLILFSSPVEKSLLFDYPKFYELIDRFLRLYGVEELENSSELPAEGNLLIQQINATSFWPGYYRIVLKDGWKGVLNAHSTYPMFEKIRQGEVWRFFTPCLLHADIFHIIFNMLWLVVLGKQIEQRMTPFRYILFIVLIGVFSNTAQYLMSGPNFLGFSGILCGMLAFIWVRQKKAAWEGYQIDRYTMMFMLIFILGMAGIQFFSFLLEKSFDFAFSPNLANMAHLSGGIAGYILGKLEFFSWRHG